MNKKEKLKKEYLAYTKKRNAAQRKHDEEFKARLLKIAIPKIELMNAYWYNGYRFRGFHVAMWNESEQKFMTLAQELGMTIVERIPHFADVADTNYDGFTPIEIIDRINNP